MIFPVNVEVATKVAIIPHRFMLKKLQKIVIFRQKLLFQLFGHHSLLLFLALLLKVLGRDAKLLEE